MKKSSIVSGVIGFAITVFSQTPETYQMIFEKYDIVEESQHSKYVFKECCNFMKAFPLHPYNGVVIPLFVKTGLQTNHIDKNYAAALLAKAAFVFLAKPDKSDFETLLNSSSGFFGKNKFNYDQKQQIRYLFTEAQEAVPIDERCLQYIQRLYHVRDKNMNKFIIKELEWYLHVLPNSNNIERARFWLATVHAESGNHLFAAGYAKTIAHQYTHGIYGKRAALLASSEYSQRPVFMYRQSADVLKWYLSTYPSDTWRPAYEQLTTLMSTKLDNPDSAAVYCRILMDQYSDSLALNDEVSQKMFDYFKENGEAHYASLIGDKFIFDIEGLLNQYNISVDRYEYYKDKNMKELRLQEYMDGSQNLIIKIILLDYINESRKKHGRPPLELDVLASRVANKMCLEAAQNDFVGHWNLDGEKPYHRYSLAGGTDHVAENGSGIWSSEKLVASFTNAIRQMKKMHDEFMAETPPNDGHKQNVLRPYHNIDDESVSDASGVFSTEGKIQGSGVVYYAY